MVGQRIGVDLRHPYPTQLLPLGVRSPSPQPLQVWIRQRRAAALLTHWAVLAQRPAACPGSLEP